MGSKEKSIATHQLGLEYAKGREAKLSLRYRLKRRTEEVLKTIRQFWKSYPADIIDLGTADGRMLHSLHEAFPRAHCVGIEFNSELVRLAQQMFPGIEITEGNAQNLTFSDNSFDVAIATAIIEHVPEPAQMIREACRVLRPGGILVLTSPAPFWEKIATFVGHLADDLHNEVMTLRKIQRLTSENGFSVLKAEKFMLSPIGMPFELAVESVARVLRCDFLMANQLVVASKK